MDGFKLWYSEGSRDRNRVGILVNADLKEYVGEVKRISDTIRLFVNVVSAYAPHMGMDKEAKRLFWEDLDEVVRGIPSIEKIFIGGDFNGHICTTFNGFDDVHRGFGFGKKNSGGVSLLEFFKTLELVIANSCFFEEG
ncbi:uncharacterized protein LOC129883595 [Solanum dulcamara]|uniref:uncharacterized protein LOC129883595 n=1 Tax=Solanum dulcamara TaxID=45834 RepID=UPI0024868AC4|nr:uncharacterized protein LOC129883595 [Solanum dulcamara]